MDSIRIFAAGSSPGGRANARGHVFERLMTAVLCRVGYRVGHVPNTNYSGMEIDIEGTHDLTGHPMYAECKCYDTEVDSSKVQGFFGKYMARWLKDNRSQGIFIALPGVNSHAKAFYQDNSQDQRVTVSLIEQDRVLEILHSSGHVAAGDVIARHAERLGYVAGDRTLACTDKGDYWVQFLVAHGSAFPKFIAVYQAQTAQLMSDPSVLQHLIDIWPELSDFERVISEHEASSHAVSIQVQGDLEEIVEVRGSSACFEYQFPASPAYFVGREALLSEIDGFVAAILSCETSARGLLLEANSGWGKSSLVLSAVSRLTAAGHLAVAIDSRAASSSQFLLRVVEYSIRRLGLGTADTSLTGFDGSIRALISIGETLKADGRVLVLFFDQFENVFSLPQTLRHIRDLLLKLVDAQTNVVLGFSWKTDFLSFPLEFPHRLQSDISTSSKRIGLAPFSDSETNALLDRLSEELHSSLRKDLRFFLSDFSQGYPWLLKKLCAHVKAQREQGVPQVELATSLLNVEALFQDDLRGLSTPQGEALRRIAKAAPVAISDLGDEFEPEVIQDLVNRRLVVKIGSKYDIYWDIFRDYLNTGRVPTQENYILRTQLGSVIRAGRMLEAAPKPTTVERFRLITGLSEGSFYNLLRDLKLLGIVKLDNGKVVLQLRISGKGRDIDESMRPFIRERLQRNRLTAGIVEHLKATGDGALTDIAALLKDACPYVSASGDTWTQYARIFADWMDFADLALFDSRRGVLRRYEVGTELRERRPLRPRRSGGVAFPLVQFRPVERVAIHVAERIRRGATSLEGPGFSKSTWVKALGTLEYLELIERRSGLIQVNRELLSFDSGNELRRRILRERALKLRTFATFIDILTEWEAQAPNQRRIAAELVRRLQLSWRPSTGQVNVKIMMDWARHLGLAPGRFARSRPERSTADYPQLPLSNGQD